MHAGCVEPIFEAVLANDLSRITSAAAAQRMDADFLISDLHWLYRGDTPLHLAAAGLRYDAARALLAAGTPVNAVNRRGAAALHYACDPRPLSPTWNPAAQQRIIELLVSAGATVDLPDRGGVTPLHRAVRARSPAAVAALLSAGADPRAATGKAGSTPLHLAVAPTGAGGTAGAGELQLEIIRMLLAAGATRTTWTTTASPWPTGSRARRCATRWLPNDLPSDRLSVEIFGQPQRILSATRMRG